MIPNVFVIKTAGTGILVQKKVLAFNTFEIIERYQYPYGPGIS